MKSNKILIGFLCIGLTLLVSCSNSTKNTNSVKHTDDSTSNSISSDKSNEQANNSNNSSNATTNNDDNITNNANNNNNSNSDTTSDYNSLDKSQDSNEKTELLNTIKARAINGMVINSDFKAKENIMTNVRNVLGSEDKIENIPEAKGNYSTYSNKELVFGFNKGEEIFEIRSYSKAINSLNLKDIKNVLGSPDYDVTTSTNERIIGYKLTEDFKLEFVLNNSSNSEEMQTLNHYGVFYPKGTANNMAGDKGREW